jgi:hypothetical protein
LSVLLSSLESRHALIRRATLLHYILVPFVPSSSGRVMHSQVLSREPQLPLTKETSWLRKIPRKMLIGPGRY